MSECVNPNLENLSLVHIYGYSEAEEAKERAEDASFGVDYIEDIYRGLRPEIIRTLLDKVGESGDNPIMASILFRAGVEIPLATPYALYNDTEFMEPIGLPKLFGVYLDIDRLQVNAAPDALLLAQGYNRKVYRGYELVVTDFWSNPESSAIPSCERRARDLAQRAMLSDYYLSDYLFVKPDTVIHEIMGEEKTVAELGIKPEDYTEGRALREAIDRIGELKNISAYGEWSELLEKYKNLYEALDPDVDSMGGEREDLYELRLDESELSALNKLQGLVGLDQLTGLSIDREDRTNIGEYRPYGDDDIDPFYTNGWGDMTIRLQLEFEGIVKCYTLSVFMDSGRRDAYLAKYTTELRPTTSWLAKEAGHMLAAIQDPLAEETDFNKIDEFEYQDLLRMVRNIQAVTTLS